MEVLPQQHALVTAKRNIRYLWWVTLLGGTEAPIFWPDQQSCEVCCLLGANIQVNAESEPLLVKSMDYYPLVPSHVAMNDTAS